MTILTVYSKYFVTVHWRQLFFEHVAKSIASSPLPPFIFGSFFLFETYFKRYLSGKFKRSRLKLLKKEPGTSISFPSDFRHTITVQHTLDHKALSGVISPHSPPGSPAIPRLRAIAREYTPSHTQELAWNRNIPSFLLISKFFEAWFYVSMEIFTIHKCFLFLDTFPVCAFFFE